MDTKFEEQCYLNLKARLVMKVGKVTEILRSFISNVAE